MDELENLQEGLESFIHRNTKTEISNFEGSFRPCLFSRIDSSSSFESSFENYAENFAEVVKEERPLSKSYKPESVLKASFLTEERNSPSFREFEGKNAEESTGILEFKHEFQKDLFKFNDTNRFFFKEENGLAEAKELFSKELGEKDRKLAEEGEENEKYLALASVAARKDEENKALRGIIGQKDKEISEISLKFQQLQGVLERISNEKEQLMEKTLKLQGKLEKSENQLVSARTAHFELQKEAQKLISRSSKEDRIRKIPEDLPPKDKSQSKLQELLSEIDFLKQELQKRPSSNQYQGSLTRIEELEGMLSKRTIQKSEKSEISLIKSLLEHLKLDNPCDILPQIKALTHSQGRSKLLSRISMLVKDCVPPGTFKSEPTHRDIWKFIRKVMESYIKLKKNDNNLVISKLQGCLGIGESGNVYQEVLKIFNSLHFMELIFDKIKAKLGLSAHATIQEVEQAIEEI